MTAGVRLRSRRMTVDARPLAILMSGAPGSGKSTLAHLLAERLRLPVVDKDRLREGALFTIGSDNLDEAPRGVELFYATVEALLGQGISVVGDMTLYPGISEPDVAARVAPIATLINVHCRASNAMARFEARMRADPLNRGRVDALLPQVAALAAVLVEPLDLGCPWIVVDTTDGYVPSIEEVVTELVRGCGNR
jgi:predicted kinase